MSFIKSHCSHVGAYPLVSCCPPACLVRVSAVMAPKETMAVTTTIALIEQFLTSLAPDAAHFVPETGAEAPSPLVLLDAAAKSLKAQVTKVSLLTINAPFTPSAVATSLQAVNDSILPSLMTATLLSTPDLFTTSFSKETKGLTRSLLRELLTLVRMVDARSKDGKPTAAVLEPKKREVTEATGRVWEACDSLVRLSEQGVPGFVARKAKQWLELMKDAVKELQEWDPEEEVDDDLFGEEQSDDDEPQTVDENKDTTDDRATISAGVKDQALKVLSRIPQSVHVLVKQRLDKFHPPSSIELSATTRKSLEDILTGTRRISDMIDESAEGMYMGDLELCLKKAGEARALTIEIVQAALEPWGEAKSGTDTARSETQEDKFIKRALEWIRQVDTGTVQ